MHPADEIGSVIGSKGRARTNYREHAWFIERIELRGDALLIDLS
jgi:hypothetical protein